MDCRKIILRTEHLVKYFGALKATNDVNLEVTEGEIHAIIGPNGAGKSTLMDEIVNRTPLTGGNVFFNNKNITGMKPFDIVNLGICKCFQISKLFMHLTCFENVQTAFIEKNNKVYDFLPKNKKFLRNEVSEVLSKVGMEDKIDETASYLSYGDQRRLEIAITLAMEPKLLMLDEPTAGVARAEGYDIMEMIRNLAKERHFTVVFIEHDMDIIFNYSDRISVLDHGTLIATDTPENIHNNSFVQNAYFGGGIGNAE
jgi:branched-chain amino acid transport system ATP-binding protein